MTQQEYKDTIDQILLRESFELKKIEKTLTLLYDYMNAVSMVIIKNGQVVKLKWFSIITYIQLARLSYKFITEMIDIWKK